MSKFTRTWSLILALFVGSLMTVNAQVHEGAEPAVPQEHENALELQNNREQALPVDVTVEVDYFASEATWNIWDVSEGAYYYETDQDFAESYEEYTVTANLTPGDYEIHTFDSWGDGGITGTVTLLGDELLAWDEDDYDEEGNFPFTVPDIDLPPMFAMDPETYEFGEVGLLDGEIFYPVENAEFTVTNEGLGEVIIQEEPYFFSGDSEQFAYEGSASYPYTINGPSSSTGEELNFEVAFNPTTPGEKSTLLVLEDNLDREVRTFEISGSAYEIPDYDIVETAYMIEQDWPNNNDFNDSGRSFSDFYDDYHLDPDMESDIVYHFSVNKPSYVELTSNAGEEDFALFPEDTEEFIEDNNIYEDAQTEVEAGSYYLIVSGEGDVDFNLNVQGTEPELVVEPTNMDLGDVPIGCWHEGSTFKVYNAGGQSITFSDATLSDENGVYTLDHRYEFPVTITTDTLYFDVYLDAANPGVYDAAFLLTDDVTTHIYDITGEAYNAPEGDAFCNPFTVAFSSGSYEHDGTIGDPMHDNYHLVEGYNDVVYEFSYATDMILDVTVDNESIDPHMAIYSAEDLAEYTPEQVDPVAETDGSELSDIELFQGTYYLILAGDAGASSTDYTLNMDVEDMPQPGDITLIAPEDGVDGVGVYPLLEWELGEYTKSIDLYTGTQYPPQNMLLDGAEPANEYQIEEQLEEGQIYFWKVVAHNDNGTTESETWAFTTVFPEPVNVTGERYDFVNVHLEWLDPFFYEEVWPEDFEGGMIPEGWTAESAEESTTAGWYITNNGSSSYFEVPEHTYYAISNDDELDDDSSEDYLITPKENFEGFDSVTLTFDSYFTGDYSQSAYVELSTDDGDTWEVIHELSGVGEWTEIELDLSEYTTSDYSDVWIGFHADDNDGWASGWAIDNVDVQKEGGAPANNAGRALTGYNIYQNGEQINEEVVEENEYDVLDLEAGTYTFGVSAQFDEGESEIVTIEEIEILGMSGIEGTVTDYSTGDPIEGASISISGMYNEQTLEYDTTTNADGEYSVELPVVPDEDSYTVSVNASEYEGQTVEDVSPVAAEYTVLDFELGEFPLPVSNVVATESEDESQATITWDEPSGYPSYEMYWDDGTPENATGWNSGFEGNMNAVKFTPQGYPATIKSAKIHIYDGSWPSGDILSPMEVVIFDDDGSGGLPGTELGVVEVTPTDYNWVEIDLSSLNVSINEGSFYIANRQISVWPDAPPTAIDETNPQGLSYAYSDGSWGTASYDHFMIRATVAGPQGTQLMNYDGQVVNIKETVSDGALAINPTSGKEPGTYELNAPTIKQVSDAPKNTREVQTYEVYRFTEDDADNMDNWTLLADDVTETEYVDSDWNSLEYGVYQFAVKAIYPITESTPAYSNLLPNNMFAQAVVIVSTNNEESPEGATVKFEHMEVDSTYEATVPASGTVEFPEVWKGEHMLTVTKEGFEPHFQEVVIDETYFIEEVMLREAFAVPENLMAEKDCKDVHLSWEEGSTGSVSWTQDFEDLFPPEGWTKEQNEGQGWFQTSDGSSSFWDVPPHDSQYACANDDQNDDDSSMDYLITPIETFQGFTQGTLTFESFFDGGYGQIATVELTTDGGDTWEVIHEVSASDSWEEISINLEDYLSSEYSQVQIGFHSDDDGGWASGWAIDNVHLELSVAEPENNADREFLGYNVYRNDQLLNNEPLTETEYDDENLAGGSYDYYVTSEYSTGESEGSNIASVDVETINPAENLTAEKQSWNNVFLEWSAPSSQQIYTIQWDDGENFTSIGTDDAFDFSVASRWYPEDLGTYDGMYLTEVSFYPAEEQSEYYIRVWTGSDATLVVDQMVPADDIEIGAWNTVELDTPVQIDASQEFWFGYRANTETGYPAGADAGPALTGKGDMLKDPDAGWVEMSTAYGLDYNWNLAGTVTTGDGEQATLTQLPDNSTSTRSGSVSQGPVNTNPQPLNLSSRELSGYNIYRNDEMIVEDHQPTFYIDYDLDIEPGVGAEFTYYVVAQYASGCTAGASNEQTVSYGSNDDEKEYTKLKVYPNPTREDITLEVTDDIVSYRIMNTVGQILIDKEINGANKFDVNTQSYEAGAYVVQFVTKDGDVTSKRFVKVE